MDWQQATALSIVALTAALFVFARLRRKQKPGLPCDSHCGCARANAPAPPSVTYHTRKGERPEIIIKLK